MQGDKMHSEIEHIGTIESIDNETIKVKIISQSACASCHAKGVCNAADMQEKIIDVVKTNDDFAVGECVNVVLKESLGFWALFLGFVLPFLIILLTLIIVIYLTNNEGIAGLASLVILVPYYGILYLKRDQLKKQFSFTLKKQ